jgi:hypothetical protein
MVFRTKYTTRLLLIKDEQNSNKKHLVHLVLVDHGNTIKCTVTNITITYYVGIVSLPKHYYTVNACVTIFYGDNDKISYLH